MATRLAIQATVVALVAGSAILTKELGKRPMPLAAVRLAPTPAPVTIRPVNLVLGAPGDPEVVPETSPVAEPAVEPAPVSDSLRYASDPAIRWFNGRPVRPARTVQMVVTAYSPDARSCGEFADGITATLHSVETNGHALVAADPTVLPYGSLLTVPGYDDNHIVPVLDCGGAIKGKRLDVLYPSHERAREWGRQKLRVTVWEYADGKPADDPRKVR
ncbi:putative protein YuiC [Phycisphaerales bacterium]|nr:putative protein YuiC [Phycisphaerales bacterium]